MGFTSKIKNVLRIYIIFILFSFNAYDRQIEEDEYIITAGVGTEHFLVGKTNMVYVFSVLGENTNFSEGIIDFRNRESIHINRYIYTKLGMVFITYTDESKGKNIENAKITSISFKKPANVMTSKGISINDSLKEVIAKYGKQDDVKDIYSDVTYLKYKSKGITFTIDDSSNKVIEITVY